MKQYMIEYETALLAEKVGLEIFVDDAWNIPVYKRNTKQASNYHIHLTSPDKKEYLFAPYQELLRKWLRDKHNLHINIDCFNGRSRTNWNYQVVKCYYNNVGLPGYILTEFNNDRNYLAYENALECGLVDALKWIEFKQNNL